MPRPRIAEDWRAWVQKTHANDRTLSAATIERLAADETARADSYFHDRDDWPSERSIGRIVEELTDLARQELTYVHWPENFIGPNAELPSEAAPEILDWLRISQSAMGGRMTLRQARWYWGIARSAPDFHRIDNHRHTFTLSVALAALEVGAVDRGTSVFRALEYYFAYRPWLSKTAAAVYLRDSPARWEGVSTVGRGKAEPFTVVTDVQLNWDPAKEPAAVMEWHQHFGGPPTPWPFWSLPWSDYISELRKEWGDRDVREAANEYTREHPA